MSLEIDWDSITNDIGLNEKLRLFLNTQLHNLELPSYLDQLNVGAFSLGKTAPEITIRHVGNPFTEFYESDGDTPNETDIQLIVEFNFQSDLYMELETNLLLNYPSTNFISLPIKLKLTKLAIHSLAAITNIGKKSFISFLCDVEDEPNEEEPSELPMQLPSLDIPNSRSNSYMGSVPLTYNNSTLRFSTGTSSHFLNTLNTSSLNNQNNNRIDIIKNLKIESELGQSKDVDGSILRNIGKIEKFLTEMLKDLIITELGWPSWLELDFSDEPPDEDNDNNNDVATDDNV